MTQVSDAGLAFSFSEVFGRSPPDYVIRLALDLCNRLQIDSLEELSELLARTEFRDGLAETYRSIIGVGIGLEEIFLAALYALAEGDNKAISWVRKKARRERDELEHFARSEALSSLPDTVVELVEAIEDPNSEINIEGWAEALGATNDCAICGTTVIQPFSFAESAVLHYEITEEDDANVHERIEAALRASGTETGGWGDGSLCAYHNEQVSQED